jgi:hypothetical protein
MWFRQGGVGLRVAKWYVFKPKIPIWEKKFQGLRLENVDIFYGHWKIFYG